MGDLDLARFASRSTSCFASSSGGATVTSDAGLLLDGQPFSADSRAHRPASVASDLIAGTALGGEKRGDPGGNVP